MKHLVPKLLVILSAVLFGLLPLSLSAAAYDFEIQDIMSGSVPGVTAVVNGSGNGYYGQSLQATFNNTTGNTYRVKVPIGLSMIPRNAGTQTMYTAGAEIITLPAGTSQSLIIAFCGEQHDSGPSRSDVFSAGGMATGSLLQTLQNINRSGEFGSTAQHAVWHHTDGYDISGDETATELAGGLGALGGTAVAGLAAAALAGGAALLGSRLEHESDVTEASEPAPQADIPSSDEPTTRIVDGPAATNWLRNEGYLNADGTVTDRFMTWWSQAGSGAPGTGRLDGIAGDISIEDGRITGDAVIIVRDIDSPPRERPPEAVGPAAEVVSENYAPGVNITGTHDFIEHTRHYLNNLSRTPTGQELLRDLGLDCIIPGSDNRHNINIVDAGRNNGNEYVWSNDNARARSDGAANTGSGGSVQFNPYRHSLPGARVNDDGTPDLTDWRNRPPTVGVGHEMIHGLDAMRGQVNLNRVPDPAGGECFSAEARAVGFGDYQNEPVTERNIRAELGLPDRPGYSSG